MRRGTETPEAPGWYPDAETGRMRRWDGRVWTGETREMPPWLAGGAAGGYGGPAPRKRIGKHWLVLGAFVAVLFLIVSAKAWNSGPELPARTVFDAAFIDAANGKCRAVLKPLKAERPQPGSPEGKDPGPKEKVAGQVDSTADRLTALAVDLRTVPVRPDEQPAVHGWLDDWVAYADLGHRYADAVRDDSRRQEEMVREGSRISRRADDFARANGLKDCTLA